MTLHFDTVFDQPVATLPVPSEVTGGQRPELQVVDRFTRGVAIVGRFALSPSLIGAKVDADPSRPLRVRLRLATDQTTEEWWHKRPPETVAREQTATGRLLLIRSQGRTRAVCYLTPATDRHGAVTIGTVEFDLPAGSVTKDGLLVLEAIDAPALPDWARSRIMPYSQVGVRIDRIELSYAVGTEPVVTPYVGRQADGFAAQLVSTWPGADGRIAPIHLRIRRQYPRASTLAGRAVKKAIRESRQRVRPDEPTIPMQQVLQQWLADGLVQVDGVALTSGVPVRGSMVARDGSANFAHGHADVHLVDGLVDEPVLLRIVTDARGVDVHSQLGRMRPVWDALAT